MKIRSRKTQLLAGIGCVAVAASVVLASTPASAHGWRPTVRPGTPTVVAEGLASPLSLQIDHRGRALITQNFAGLLSRVDASGTVSTLASAPGLETSAVTSRGGTVYYSQLAFGHETAVMMALRPGGTPRQIADIQGYEAKKNPDRVNHYGFVGLPQACLDQIPDDAAAPGAYTGIVDTHPYAALATSKGIYVADAGANAIFRISYSGRVSTAAVLPPAPPVTVSAELAAGAGFPDCVVGYSYRFESVPTDVELGPDGWLYVTVLPGGPEDPSLGARGSVYKVNPSSGAVKRVATGFAGATGLAVAKDGTIFVAELFGGATGSGQVSIVRPHRSTPKPFVALGAPAAIEVSGKKLYVTTNALAEGPEAALTVVPLKYSRR